MISTAFRTPPSRGRAYRPDRIPSDISFHNATLDALRTNTLRAHFDGTTCPRCGKLIAQDSRGKWCNCPEFRESRIYDCREEGHCAHILDTFETGMHGLIIERGTPIARGSWSLSGINTAYIPTDGMNELHIGSSKYDLVMKGNN